MPYVPSPAEGTDRTPHVVPVRPGRAMESYKFALTLDSVSQSCENPYVAKRRAVRLELRDIEDAAKEQGWAVGRTRRGHPTFRPPDPSKDIVVGSGTASDVRAIRNLLSRLRRQGFVWPWPPEKGRK